MFGLAYVLLARKFESLQSELDRSLALAAALGASANDEAAQIEANLELVETLRRRLDDPLSSAWV